jgi:iron complex transport system substrate-binding protein
MVSMKRVFLSLALLLIAAILLAGCSQAAPATSAPALTTTTAPAQTTVTDDAGRVVTIKSTPKRIISLSPSNTEILFALGLADQVVGVTTYDNYPPAAASKEKLSGFSDVNIEKVVSLQPDLVLAASLHTAKIVPALEQLGITVLVLKPGTISQILKDIQLIGDICGKSAAAKTLNAALQKRVDAVTSVSNSLTTEKPRILYVTWHDPIWTAGDDTIIGELIRDVHGTNIAADLTSYATMTLEAVIGKNPQIIIVMSSMGDQTSLNYINSEPRLQSVDALKNKQVYTIDADIFGRTTPRIVDGLESLAKIVQPQAFK